MSLYSVIISSQCSLALSATQIMLLSFTGICC